MTIFQALFADGDELAFIARGATAFGKPIYRSVPENVLLAIHDPFDIRFHILVFMNRNSFLECFYVEQFTETVFPAKLRVLCGSNKVLQYFPLRIQRVVLPGFNAPEAHTGERRYGWG